MHKKIIVDQTKCTGCMMCAQVCSLVKTGTFNPPASRIRVIDFESSGVTIPILCQHCARPACLPACPVNAISKEPQTGVVGIDPEICVNCPACRFACPYAGPVYSAPEKQVCMCDMCGGTPSCVDACPTGALTIAEHAADDQEPRLTAMSEAKKALVRKERR